MTKKIINKYQIKKLGEVCDVIAGQVPASLKKFPGNLITSAKASGARSAHMFGRDADLNLKQPPMLLL